MGRDGHYDRCEAAAPMTRGRLTTGAFSPCGPRGHEAPGLDSRAAAVWHERTRSRPVPPPECWHFEAVMTSWRPEYPEREDYPWGWKQSMLQSWTQGLEATPGALSSSQEGASAAPYKAPGRAARNPWLPMAHPDSGDSRLRFVGIAIPAGARARSPISGGLPHAADFIFLLLVTSFTCD